MPAKVKANNQIQLQAQYALDMMRSQESVERRKMMQKRIDYYMGDSQLEYLEEALDEQFTYPDRLKLQLEIYNITDMIINEAAVLYNEEPYREVRDDKNEVAETDKEIYSEIVEDSNLNSVMKTAQRLTKLCKTVLIRPVWRDDKIDYDILTPNMFDVIQDPTNRTKATAIIYASAFDFEYMQTPETPVDGDVFSSQYATFYYWSATDHFIFQAQYNVKKQKWEALVIDQNGNEENINPYGVIPFTILRDGIPVDTFFMPGGDELIVCNEISNVKLTEKNNLTKMQSFSIPVRKGATNNSPFVLDPSMTVDLPSDDDMNKGSDFWFETPSPKLTEISEDIDSRVRRVAIKYNLNPERFTTSAAKSSADALQMRAFDQAKQIKADKPDWRGFEKDLFKLTKIVFNYEAKKQLTETCSLFIDYMDVETPMTQADKDAHNTLMLENDLMSKAQWLMEENPDIRNEQEAEDRIKKNQEDKAEESKIKQDQFVASGMSQMTDQPGQPGPDTGTPPDKTQD